MSSQFELYTVGVGEGGAAGLRLKQQDADFIAFALRAAGGGQASWV
jgi:predicted peptidase